MTNMHINTKVLMHFFPETMPYKHVLLKNGYRL